MLEFAGSDGMLPFTFSLVLMLGFLVLEVVLLLLGISFDGAGDGPDIDVDADIGIDVDPGMDGAGILEAAEIDLAEIDAELDVDAGDGAAAGISAGGSLASWLGFGKAPFIIWLSAVLLSFGLSGAAIQLVANGIFGVMLPSWIAAIPAGFAAAGFAGAFSSVFAKMLPKIETESVSIRSLHRHSGVVSQGISRRGRPAEVKIKDRFGNLHYPLLEPFSDEDAISEGSEVLALWNIREGALRIVQTSDQS